MKLYLFVLVVLGIVIAIFGSGCAATNEQLVRQPLEIGKPGDTIVEFTDSKQPTRIHETPATPLRRNTLTTFSE
jgi:hypothetical protein